MPDRPGTLVAMLELRFEVPNITADDAARALSEHWGVKGSLSPLPGERDRNFLVRTADGNRFVLKFANAGDDRALLELQNAALAHVAARGCRVPIPQVVPSQDGEPIVALPVEGTTWLVRLLTWVPGEPLAEWRPHAPALLADLGQSLGDLNRALEGFRHPAGGRSLKWDLAKASWIREHLPRIAAPETRAAAREILDRFEREAAPVLPVLRRGIRHNDANDHNVLVLADTDGTPKVSGLVDFGDLLETPVACDLAIALAYAMLDKPDPVTAAVHVVRGFHAVFPLEERELTVLPLLVRTRLAVSVTNAALQRDVAPDHAHGAYLQISEAGASRLLEQLRELPDRFIEYRWRDACGLPPCPASAAVSAWIDAHPGTFTPVIDPPPVASDVHVLDLDVASTELGTVDVWRDTAKFTRHVFDFLIEQDVSAGVGRYDEVRPIYTTDLFRVAGNDGPEWRTVHTAIDLFQPAGAPIFAPLGGRVHSVRDNDNPGDYGPTVILEHHVAEGLTFWTLYGHLSRATLSHLGPGDELQAGDRVGWLGSEAENGGWAPHLHFQIICDLLDRTGDFPGVARPAEREVWLSLSPDPSAMLGLPPSARAPRAPSVAALRERRARTMGRSLSISYRRPLHLVRGMMQFLIDAEGRRYLDAVNNVAHVGHAHPDVVRAGQRQMAVLNTNTRYLHELMLEYAERLTATLPEPLRVCFFVCSGSEANELALRLARAHTGERDVVVLEAGYHGNTTTLVDVSPYKFDGPGGSGAPPWVHKVPMPDTYRGPFRRDDPQAGLKYAQAVRDAVGRVRQTGRRPAAFLCESILSCGGQIVLPPGYLTESYRHVRAAGGVCIADEVQVGFGRVGSHPWAFQLQGVVPDIVTMGKPIGNGHPLGAVVTTPEVAASFANGMEYFNTFGGNPVSCAIGLAVLDVLEREALQARAARLGDRLRAGLAGLMERHPLLGDVRGAGLFLGVELVLDRDQRIPATRQAAYVADRMRDGGVLVSTDGPDHNVLKIKPPMCVDERDADQLVATLDRVLGEAPARPGTVAAAPR
ncbi:MAG TPA: aminotransferase class III-fold pyridoxal phosphate-dependent enzyme [Gemmatimonadaceae bacterium]|nr:aminotransferase class III-fold pyridoxal phosphate-dependent enzyme [Gemmatimonadaceae bacterium]